MPTVSVVLEDSTGTTAAPPSKKTIDRLKRDRFAGFGEVEPDLGPLAVLNAPGNYDSREEKSDDCGGAKNGESLATSGKHGKLLADY